MHKERLESNQMSGACISDKRYVEELERELRNCSLEIGYLQDQLNLRNVESNCMGEHVLSLEVKLAEVGTLHRKIRLLNKALVQSDSRRVILTQELKDKEEQLHNSALQIEELESAIASVALESQCEIESMKLEITALEERCFEAERLCQQAAQETEKLELQLEESDSHIQRAQERIHYLEIENDELKQKLKDSEMNAKLSCCKVADQFNTWLKHDSRISFCGSGGSCLDFLVQLRKKLPVSRETCTCEGVLYPVVSNPSIVAASGDNVKDETKTMLNQICELEIQVAQLKEELRTEKLKANEEADDLTQEMAELRYQITDMLEDECKRRASIEQASLRRIQDLEDQVRKEQKRSLAAIRHFQEVRKLAEMRALEVNHLKNALEEFRQITDPETARRIESRHCGNHTVSENLNGLSCKDISDLKTTDDLSGGYTWNQGSIEWYPDDEAPSTSSG